MPTIGNDEARFLKLRYHGDLEAFKNLLTVPETITDPAERVAYTNMIHFHYGWLNALDEIAGGNLESSTMLEILLNKKTTEGNEPYFLYAMDAFVGKNQTLKEGLESFFKKTQNYLAVSDEAVGDLRYLSHEEADELDRRLYSGLEGNIDGSRVKDGTEHSEDDNDDLFRRFQEDHFKEESLTLETHRERVDEELLKRVEALREESGLRRKIRTETEFENDNLDLTPEYIEDITHSNESGLKDVPTDSADELSFEDLAARFERLKSERPDKRLSEEIPGDQGLDARLAALREPDQRLPSNKSKSTILGSLPPTDDQKSFDDESEHHLGASTPRSATSDESYIFGDESFSDEEHTDDNPSAYQSQYSAPGRTREFGGAASIPKKSGRGTVLESGKRWFGIGTEETPAQSKSSQRSESHSSSDEESIREDGRTPRGHSLSDLSQKSKERKKNKPLTFGFNADSNQKLSSISSRSSVFSDPESAEMVLESDAPVIQNAIWTQIKEAVKASGTEQGFKKIKEREDGEQLTLTKLDADSKPEATMTLERQEDKTITLTGYKAEAEALVEIFEATLLNKPEEERICHISSLENNEMGLALFEALTKKDPKIKVSFSDNVLTQLNEAKAEPGQQSKYEAMLEAYEKQKPRPAARSRPRSV